MCGNDPAAIYGAAEWLTNCSRKPNSPARYIPMLLNPNEHGVHLNTEDGRNEVFSVPIGIAARRQ